MGSSFGRSHAPAMQRSPINIQVLPESGGPSLAANSNGAKPQPRPLLTGSIVGQ